MTATCLDDVLDRGQTDATPAVALGRKEQVENPGFHFFRHSNTTIGHCNDDKFPHGNVSGPTSSASWNSRGGRANGYGTRVTDGIAGIDNQVNQHLIELSMIDLNEWHIGGQCEGQRNPASGQS